MVQIGKRRLKMSAKDSETLDAALYYRRTHHYNHSQDEAASAIERVFQLNAKNF
jgi:alkylhydroperoxidase family enzyme